MLYNKTLSIEPGSCCLADKISMSFGYASSHINDPFSHLTIQYTSCFSYDQYTTNYQRISDLKGLTWVRINDFLWTVMNYNYGTLDSIGYIMKRMFLIISIFVF